LLLILSAMFIFGVKNFNYRGIWCEKPSPKTGARKKWESIYGAGFWSVCDVPNFVDVSINQS